MENAPEGVLFRVLGPFEAHVDGRAVPLGAPRQRALLAALLANANAVVSTDRLIDIVWGDEPPATALSTLQKYVYRLRGSLGDRILTRPPGYVLRLDRGESDASRFESLLAGAAGLATAGEVDEAIAAFDAALALWRGPAWAEFADFDFARVEVARLDGLRATAVEDRMEVALAAGRHAEVIGELQATVARYPLRERPRSQLMLALYRAGRHADAMRAYDAFRHYLGEEVGLEPSAELAQLADAILLQKPELAWVPPPGARGRAALPSGTVTFLFTDIEGSTRLFRRLGHAYVEVLERHRQLVRGAVASAGGVEVNSEGDGLFFAFSSAASALAASVAAQRGIGDEPWPSGAEVRVRMGMHTGEATPYGGDYIALPVHQAARVRDAAHGGQVLLSQATVGTIATMPGECSVQALGTFPLNDFEDGVELFEAHHPSLPATFPPPRVGVPTRSAAPLPAVLATDTESLVGRATELGWLDVLWQRAVAGGRVTAVVHGPPGIGKSRLVAEFARRAHARGATVTVALPDAERGGAEPVVAVLDDFDGTELGPAASGVFVLAASREPVAGTPNVRELRGLNADEVALVLAQKIDTVALDLSSAIHSETHGNPGQVHDAARRLRDREAEQRVQRALERVGGATREARLLRDAIAGGVLERGRLAAQAHDGAVLGLCPYKGLARYEVADAPFFYGRERLVATLVARLAVDRFVGIIGASGSGKSSLVRAGLLPALSARALPGSDVWPTCTFTPGEHPLRQFAQALAPLAEVPAPELSHRLDRRPDEVGLVLATAVRGRPGARVVVVVDQFEEVATLCRDPEERERFAGVLVDAVTDPDIPVVLVPVVRADYYGALAVHPELARLFEQSQLLVGAMTDAELRRAIAEPARRAGLVLEDWLADAVCADAGSEPGALPLVSTALAETWARRDGSTLTLAGYREAGGVQGALARLADDVYAGLDEADQALARRLFLRLAEPGEGTDDVRRRMPRTEFGGDEEADAVLDAFVDRRLLTADAGTVEVAHEALLREWPRLRVWLEEDRAGRHLHRQLTLSAAAWDGEGRDAGALYRGTRLDAALEWSAAHSEDVNAVEHEFLAASADAQHAELRKARSTARRLRRLTAGVALVAVLALLAGGVAFVQRSNADSHAAAARRSANAANAARVAADNARTASDVNRLAAQARALAATQLDRALLLAVQSRHLSAGATTDGAVESVLATVAPGLDRIINLGAYTGQCPFISPNGRYIAAADSAGVVHLIDVAHPEAPAGTLPGALGLGGCPSAVFNRDSTHIVGAGSDGTVVVWDTATGRQVGATIENSPGWFAFAFEPGPGRLITTSTTGKILIWDTSDPAHPHTIGAPFQVPFVQFTPIALISGSIDTGRLVVGTGGWGQTDVYDLATHHLAYPPLPGDPANLSPDGRTLLLNNRASFTLWDVATGKQLGPPLPGITPGFSLPEFSPDGSKLLVPDAPTSSVRVFDVRTRQQVGAPIPVDVDGGAMGFLDDGRVATYTGQDVELWRTGAAAPAPFATVLAAPPAKMITSFADHSSRVLTAQEGGAQVWDAASGKLLGPLLGGRLGALAEPTGPLGIPVFAVPAVSADGGLVAVGRADGTVEVWDATSNRRLDEITTGLKMPVAAWAPDGRVLATAGADGEVALWDASDPAHVVRLAHQAAPPKTLPLFRSFPVFSPDGNLVAVAPAISGLLTHPAVVEVVGVPSGAVVQRLTVPVGVLGGPQAGPAAFSPDSRTLAVPVSYNTTSFAGGFTGAVALFDVVSGRVHGTLSLPYAPSGVGWTAHGTRLVTAAAAPGGYVDVSHVRSRIDVWDAATLQEIGDPVTVPGDAGILAMDVSGGSRMASGSTTSVGEPLIWDLDPGHWELDACQLAGRNLTRAEWDAYLPGRPYRATCPQWPAGT